MSLGPALALLRRFWPVLPIGALAIAVIVLRAQLVDARHDLERERSAAKLESETASRKRAELVAANAQQEAKATSTFADRLAARSPLIIRSTDTVREYAQTDAGRALCLGPDRVRAIDALDAARPGASEAAGGSPRAVQPLAGDPAARR
ncbi:MAG: hypothetical protein PGN12_05920 [Sphingomonas phyllosphaerae]